jgi:hypothetical protein
MRAKVIPAGLLGLDAYRVERVILGAISGF